MQMELIPASPRAAADNVASDAPSIADVEEALAEQQKAAAAVNWQAAADLSDDEEE